MFLVFCHQPRQITDRISCFIHLSTNSWEIRRHCFYTGPLMPRAIWMPAAKSIMKNMTRVTLVSWVKSRTWKLASCWTNTTRKYTAIQITVAILYFTTDCPCHPQNCPSYRGIWIPSNILVIVNSNHCLSLFTCIRQIMVRQTSRVKIPAVNIPDAGKILSCLENL